MGPSVLCLVSLSNILFVYSGLSAPDTLARLSTAMPPQGFGGSQGSEGDYQWSTYEQYGGGGADLRPPFQQYSPMAASERDMSLCTLSESTVNVNDSGKNVLLKPQRPQRGF